MVVGRVGAGKNAEPAGTARCVSEVQAHPRSRDGRRHTTAYTREKCCRAMVGGMLGLLGVPGANPAHPPALRTLVERELGETAKISIG